MAQSGQPATIVSLGEALLQKIFGLLEFQDQGRAACAYRAFCEAARPLDPALCYHSAHGNAVAVLELVLAGGAAGLGARHPAVPATALHLASIYGRAEVVSILMTGGMRPDEADRHGSLPLELAAASGHASTVERLLKTRVSIVDLPVDRGATALWSAACAGHAAVV